jgi:SPP1 family predicted phage head-tail adaptor
MQAGALRHRLTIQAAPRVPVRDTTGAAVEVWEDVAEVWGSVEPLSGRELMSAQQLNAELSHRVRLRYLPGLSPIMQIRYGTRRFRLYSIVDPDERHREQICLCSEWLEGAAGTR